MKTTIPDHHLNDPAVQRQPPVVQTAAPWAWQKFGKEWCLTGQHGMRPIVLATRKGALTSLVDGRLVPFDPNHPDAKVIEAAPEMLAALENVESLSAVWVGTPAQAEALRRVRAAIAAAKQKDRP